MNTMISVIDWTKKPEYNYKLTAEQLNIIRPYKDLMYLDTIVEKLMEVYEIDLKPEYKSNLKTYVYLASGQFRQEAKDKATQELIAQGWNKLTPEIAETLNGQKIQVLAKKQSDWLTSKINKIVKIQVLESGIFLLPPRHTRSGYYLSSLDNPMYKTI